MSAHSITSRGLAGRKIPQGTLTPMGDLLFAASEPGAWYDPSDISTLFQDSAGSTPVTAVEQPVGRMLDKSGRGNHATQATTTKRPVLSRRVNLITGSEMTGGEGGTPGTAPDGWQLHIMNGTYGHTVEVGKHRFSATSGRSTIRNPITWVPNTSYTVEITLTNNAAPIVVTNIIYVGLWSGTTGVSTTYYIDGVVGTQISPGTHKVKIVTSFTGGTPLQFLYVGVGAGSPDSGDVTLVDASVTLSTDAHLPYQRVTTAADYDADPAKFPAYLRFDGVDDALQTGDIDFSSTDKMTVWAGVTKLSNSVYGLLLEHGTTGANADFSVWAPYTGSNYRGDAAQGGGSQASAPALPAPRSDVLSLIGDRAAGLVATLRVAGGVYQSALTSPPGGNYTNQSLYIGSRAGTSNFLNGRLYSLIVRGAQSSLSQIEATELYIKQKMRMP